MWLATATGSCDGQRLSRSCTRHLLCASPAPAPARGCTGSHLCTEQFRAGPRRGRAAAQHAQRARAHSELLTPCAQRCRAQQSAPLYRAGASPCVLMTSIASRIKLAWGQAMVAPTWSRLWLHRPLHAACSGVQGTPTASSARPFDAAVVRCGSSAQGGFARKIP